MADNSSKIAKLSTNIKTGVLEALKNTHTIIPGIIESFEPSNQTCSVQPVIQRIFVTREEDSETETVVNLPLCINVPVCVYGSNGFSLTTPINKGEECLLVFSERAIDSWFKTGEVSPPNDVRMHDLSDGIAILGLNSLPNVIGSYDNENMQLRSSDGNTVITLFANGEITVKSPSKVTVESPEAEFTGNVKVLGNLDVSGVITAPTIEASSSLKVSGKEMLTHTHSQAPDSDGNSEQDTSPPL